MLLLRRFARRASGALWSTWYALLAPFKWISLKYRMRSAGISERYLWDAFSYLAGLDMDEPMWAGSFQVYGCGYYLEMFDEDLNFKATLQQVGRRKLVVYLWKDARQFDLGFGAKGDTQWWEVYRTGRHVSIPDLAKVYVAIRRLYGNGTTPALVVTNVDVDKKTITVAGDL